MYPAPPSGDPAAMRSFALSLRVRAERIAAQAARLNLRVDRMKFEGPAASEFRDSMRVARRQAEAAAAEIKGVANYLLSASARLETEIAEWRRDQIAAVRQAESR